MAPLQKPKRSQGRRLGRWIVLALAIHAELILVIGLSTYFWAPREEELAAARRAGEPPESIEISTLDDEAARRILAELEREEEKAKEEQAKKEEEANKPPGQVVDLAKPRDGKRPDQAKFAAEHDSSVEKEMKKLGKFDEKSRQGDRQGDAEQSTPETPPAPPQKQQPSPMPPGALAMRSPPGPRGKPAPPGVAGEATPEPVGLPGEPVELPLDAEGDMARKGTGVPVAPQVPAGAQAGGPQIPQGAPPAPLQPSQQQLARAIGSGTQDHLKDIDDGEETALNAKKWKFASFFNRVKQQVRDHWRPGEEYRRRDPSGSIYGQKDRYTLLRVALKADGSLANVALELPSGVEFLDDVAIEAFKLAQPFPNPPKQLVDNDNGLINFRFGFYFELSGAPKMKIFRYNSM